MARRSLIRALIASCSILAPAITNAAPIISVGSYTVPATPLEPFLVPIVISDAVQVTAWSFDLEYDPTDLQINDPAALDPLGLGRFVTEGDFFAAGDPFNLLVPGVLVLDAVTLAQTGLLFGVQGAYGGLPPPPSGSGILAYVEFIAIGPGGSMIRVANENVTSAVPEPSIVLLLGTGCGLFLRRRRSRDAQQTRTTHSTEEERR